MYTQVMLRLGVRFFENSARAFPPFLYVRLAQITGVILKITGTNDALRKVKSTRRIKPDTPIEILDWLGESFQILDLSRLSRILKGKDRAGERMNERYKVDFLLQQNKPDLVLDIGANIGEFSLWCVKKNFKVIAFEPDSLAFKCLQFNLSTYENVEFRNYGLAASSGLKEFFIASTSADSSLISSNKEVSVKKIQTMTWIDYEKVSPLSPNVRTLLKMDAEGFEPEVLIGFGEQLRLISWLTIDVGTERNGERTEEAVREILEAQGFEEIYLAGPNILHAKNPQASREQL